ncbi:uncharacterized protein LOC111015343 isoform X1 [Momordica charantia]|uniref:Uncharacterized protein LOC111015343 isoform X1 n=1 Tax=Momordica charantia TaxID=3673 RepID=A0A6J1CW52_MOMCH|nr:uncharacterized protein LOC111015343 isoform X1 [Momordica charantia]
MITHLCSLRQSPTSPFVSTFLSSSPSSYPNFGAIPRRISVEPCRLRNGIICGAILPVDPWAPNIDSQSIASQVFAFSLFPYIGFLYFITKSKTAPKLTLFGFYFLLAFVGATIPAGIYAKVQYGTSLSNVDWLHGGAESLLTLTNLFIVLGLRGALRKSEEAENSTSSTVLELEKEKS